MGMNYYPHKSTPIETLTSVALVFIFLSVILGVISALVSRLGGRVRLMESRFSALVEVFSVTALAVVYVPAAILVFKKIYPETTDLFWRTGYGVFPILILACAIFLRIFFKDGFRRKYHGFVGLFWKPAAILLVVSIVWVPIFYIFSQERVKPAQASLLPGAEQRGLGEQKPNIILITFDALSANHMSLYGYDRETTPFWKSLAEESFVFERMHSNFYLTQPSLTSILTSKYPWTHGVHAWLESLKVDSSENIASELADVYYTAAIVPSIYQYPEFMGLKEQFDHSEWVGSDYLGMPALYRFVSSLGFSPYAIPIFRHAVFLNHGNPISALDMPFESTSGLLREKRDRPVFIWTHIWPPHYPFEVLPDFKGRFLPAGVEVNEVMGNYTQAQEADVAGMRARYDESVLYIDHALKLFINALKESGQYEKSIIIVTADHGETLERGYSMAPSPLMYESLFHIPLLIHLPGQTDGVRVLSLAEQVDLSPTMLDLINMPIPEWMEGESLVPYMDDPTKLSEKTKFSAVLPEQGFDRERPGWRFSAYRDEYKLIYHMYNDSAVLFKVKGLRQIEEDLSTTHKERFRQLKLDLFKKIEKNYDYLNMVQKEKEKEAK